MYAFAEENGILTIVKSSGAEETPKMAGERAWIISMNAHDHNIDIINAFAHAHVWTKHKQCKYNAINVSTMRTI